MAAPTPPNTDEGGWYEPVFIVELFLDSGLYVFATREVEINVDATQGVGYGQGAYMPPPD